MSILIIPKIAEESLILDAYNAVMNYCNQIESLYVEVTICDAATIQSVNNESRDINEVTDVLSFPTLDNVTLPIRSEDYIFDIDPETNEIMLGEILICESRAREQAEEYGHSYSRELAYLTVHGLLHLLGYDHVVDTDKSRMREVEESVLKSIGQVRV